MKVQTILALLDLLQSEGGHVLIAMFLLLFGLFALAHWGMQEGKELFAYSMGILGYALKRSSG